MAIGQDLTNALSSFAEVERMITAFGASDDASNAAELVRVRRDLVLEFARLGNALENDPHLKANPEQLTQATRLFSAFRSQNSINQANWPAISVRDNPADYKAACQSVRERSQAFWTWIQREHGFRR